MSTIGNEAVRKNTGAEIGVRRRLNFIEGANVTLTIVDDPLSHEIDITIAAVGAAGTSWLDQFYPVANPEGNKGTYATVVMADDLDVTVRQTFVVPSDTATINSAVVVIIPNATGNLRRAVSTNFGELCNNEDYQTHTDSIAAGQVAVTADEIECIDISAALTGVLGDDIVGIEFTREASDALDTINDDVHYLGILFRGNA